MARHVVSLVRSASGGLQPTDPVLEANAYAVAEDLHLSMVLQDDGVELAVAGGEVAPGTLAGVALPPAATAQDLRGLLESGVRVVAAAEDLAARGLAPDELVDGTEVIDAARVAALLRDCDAVVAW